MSGEQGVFARFVFVFVFVAVAVAAGALLGSGGSPPGDGECIEHGDEACEKALGRTDSIWMVRTTKLAEEHVEGLPDGLFVCYVVGGIVVVASLDALHVWRREWVFPFVPSWMDGSTERTLELCP